MRRLFVLIVVFFNFFNFSFVKASEIGDRLKGKILLQVEENGEAWYVSPETNLRYFLGRPDDAFEVMRSLGVGITNRDLNRIPDDKNFTLKHLGKIFLQVEENGEAWYINPNDKKKYFLGSPKDAFNVMRELGLGVSNVDIQKINSANQTEEETSELKFLIHEEINKERLSAGLKPLTWNHEVALVALIQSQSLAEENKAFTGFGKTCDYPMIHHENLSEGFYNSDRLKKSDIYYYSEAGENIALYSAASFRVSFIENDQIYEELDNCVYERTEMGESFKKRLKEVQTETEKINIINNEIGSREKLFNEKSEVTVKGLEWYDLRYLAKEIVQGWMDSPGHRENILHENYDEAGIGVVIQNSYAYATQVFIKRAECGYQGGECCTKTGYLPYCFVPLECSKNICLQQ